MSHGYGRSGTFCFFGERLDSKERGIEGQEGSNHDEAVRLFQVALCLSGSPICTLRVGGRDGSRGTQIGGGEMECSVVRVRSGGGSGPCILVVLRCTPVCYDEPPSTLVISLRAIRMWCHCYQRALVDLAAAASARNIARLITGYI